MTRPRIEAVTAQTLPEFAQFLHQHLQQTRTPEDWRTGLRQHWLGEQPNYGFVLRQGSEIVGGIGAYYAEREVQGRRERFCNITSWCVLEAYRQNSMRLALSVLSQPGFHFTDFSPTQVVGTTLRFFKFKELDERVAVILNLPGWPHRGVQVLDTPWQIEVELQGEALKIYQDHAIYPWLQHVLLGRPGQWCHIIYKRQTFKQLPAATVLYLSDPAVFTRDHACLAHYFLRRGLITSHVECRFLAMVPGWYKVRAGFNRKLFLSDTLDAADIDYLYSETMALNL